MKSNAIMKYSVKNNMNYTQDGCGEAMEGHNLIIK